MNRNEWISLISTIFDPNSYRVNDLILSSYHLATLGVFILVFICLYIFRDRPWMKHVRWGLFTILVGTELALLVWTVHHGLWNIHFNLPLQLCTISVYLCAVMLYTRSYRLFEILYFFGMGGAIQAMITPDLFYTFPHFRFIHFFLAHIAIILAVLYMVWVEKYTVTFYSLIKSFIVLNILALFAFIVNVLTGANYMFLARKPQGPSILDWLGPYPWYILSLEGIVLAIFILLYLPFHGKKTSS